MSDAQPSIDAAHPHAQSPGSLPVVEKPLRAMHLAQAFRAEHRAAASHVKREIAAHILDRRGHASRGADRAVVRARGRRVRLAGPRPRIARREARVVVMRYRFGARHPERPENAPLDVPRPGIAARRGDHFAEQGVADVGILPLRARRIRGAEMIGNLRRKAGLAPPRARQVALQARAVREQFADRDVERSGIAGMDRSSLYVVANPVVEPELPVLVQLQDRERGESLGDGADAVERLRRRRPLRAQIGVAEGLGPDGPIALHDRKRNAGEMLLLGRMRGPRIEEGKRLRDTACHGSDLWRCSDSMMQSPDSAVKRRHRRSTRASSLEGWDKISYPPITTRVRPAALEARPDAEPNRRPAIDIANPLG